MAPLPLQALLPPALTANVLPQLGAAPQPLLLPSTPLPEKFQVEAAIETPLATSAQAAIAHWTGLALKLFIGWPGKFFAWMARCNNP
jgi:hypothetical protein